MISSGDRGSMGKEGGVMGHNWGNGSSNSGMADVIGSNSFACGDWDQVLHVTAGHLGDDVAVLNLHGDNDHLRVVNATLGGDLTAGVFDGSGDGVSNGVCDGEGSNNGCGMSNKGGSGVMDASICGVAVESVSLGFCVGITLGNGMVTSSREGSNRGITEDIGELLAELHIFDLLSIDCDGVANVFGRWDTVLGDHDLVVGDTVGGGGVVGYRGGGNERSCYWGGKWQMASKVLGVGFCVRVGRRGGISHSNQTGQGEELHDVECVDDFPRC